MASSSGRCGDFSPHAKGFLERIRRSDGLIDNDTTEKSVEIAGKREPRRMLTTASISAAPEDFVVTSSKPPTCTAAITNAVKSHNYAAGTDEGCKVCHRDIDHPNLLLCEACNDEYHTYCLDPPLTSVPEGDFFCDKCKRSQTKKDDDGLEFLVSALPPAYTSRFGEIVWAAGGVGFGWWPACIYDPRLTVGGARQLARKNLGKRHLIYFFECNEAPFTVLSDNRLTRWDDGFIEEYDLGKVAKSGGKNRYTHFERALHVAHMEAGRPIEMRMDWNHEIVTPLPKIVKQKQPPPPPSNSSPTKLEQKQQLHKKQKLSSPTPIERLSSSSSSSAPPPPQNNSMVNRKNLITAISSLNDQGGANAIEPSEDGILVCKILRRLPAGGICNTVTEGIESSTNLGFVALPSRQSATFAAIRRAVESDLDDDMFPSDEKGRKRWKFYVPKLGPMSVKQEGKIGPALEFLKSTTEDVHLGNGTASNPLKVVIMDM
mmetsp:Transcript_15921/g.33627  ORF Transcript_15921/g.33627 Transcript_15921/m.33627 type:complete len:488 (+) Transcript_15921:82-1545(+)